MRLQADADLIWYFQDSARELGFRASPIGHEPQSNVPTQNWPSASQCKAARRQTNVRRALRQLSSGLQSVLECAYEARPMTVENRHKYDLAAPLVERIFLRWRMTNPSKEDKKKLEALVLKTTELLEAAHTAFRIAYGPPESKSKPERRRQRVSRWLADEGLAAG